MTHV